MVHVEWRPFRKPSRMFLRILIYMRGEVGNGKNRYVLFRYAKENDGLSEAAAEGECFLKVPQKLREMMTF